MSATTRVLHEALIRAAQSALDAWKKWLKEQ
jgi:hypothetical protein